jgi:hypothetical protein
LAFGRIPLKSLIAEEAPAPAMASRTTEVHHLNLNPAVQGLV